MIPHPAVVQTYLPTAHQRIAAGVLAVVAMIYLVRLMRRNVLREEHALLWLLVLAGLCLAMFVNPVLITISELLGIVVPASALLLLGVFFLFIICVWLTCVASRHERRIAMLIMNLSIEKFKRERDTSRSQRAEIDGE